MTKNELAEQLSKETGLTRSQSINAVEGIMKVMRDTFIKREDIFLRGLGTFKIVVRKGKTARDITHGTQVIIPCHYAVTFKPCKELKEKVQ